MQGAPSVVHAGAGAVGATELLLHSEAQIFEVDYRGAQGIAAIASALERLALDAAELARVSQAARAKALSWHERANAQQLVEHIHAHVLRELESKAMT